MAREQVNPMLPLESTTTTPVQDPRFAGMLENLQQRISGLPQFNFQDYLNQSFSGPYFEQVSQGLLGALAPQERTARQNLSDMFRNVGMQGSTAFGQGMANLMGQQGAYRNQLMANLAQNLLGTSLQAGRLGLESALAPITAQTGLLRSLPTGQMATENINMPGMLELLSTLRGATGGGGGGMTMPQFEAWMRGGQEGIWGGPRPTAGAGGYGGGYGESPSVMYGTPSGRQEYDWWGQPTGGGLESALSSPYDQYGGMTTPSAQQGSWSDTGYWNPPTAASYDPYGGIDWSLFE